MKEEQEMNNLSDNLTKEIDELFDEEASKKMDEAVDAVIQASETDDDMIFEVADELSDDDDYIDPADLFDSVTEKDIEKLKDNSEKPAEVPADDDEAWSVDDVPKKKNKSQNKNKKVPVAEKKEESAKTKAPETKPAEKKAPEKPEEAKETAEKDSDNDFVPVLDLSDVDMEYKEPETDNKPAEAEQEADDKTGDEMFEDINLALSEQVEKQLGPSFADLLEEEENASARLKEKNDSKDGDEEDDEDKKGIWAIIPLWLKILLGILLFLVLFGLFLLFTKPGHVIVSKIAAKFVTSNVGNIEDPDKVQHIGEEKLPGEVSVLYTPTPDPDSTKAPDEGPTPTPLPTPVTVDDPFEEDTSVINILLIGEENYYHEFRGRSDAMMVASLDKDGGDLKLVSFMRDMYVEIPGYSDNKLNAAYAIGGAPLLMQTLEKNFGVKCDGYVLIQYDGFETIIDSLGGLDISLTQEEAEYLNSTDYISKPEQRNVVPGKQHMTGAQVLGYCRIRKVDTANGLKYDYGRTYRQRLVLTELFNKYKSKGITDLYSIMTKCLKYVTISEGLDKTIEECLQAVVDKSMYNLVTYRVPFEEKVDGKTVKHYTSTTINGQQVLCVYPDTAQMLHDILYGVDDE